MCVDTEVTAMMNSYNFYEPSYITTIELLLRRTACTFSNSNHQSSNSHYLFNHSISGSFLATKTKAQSDSLSETSCLCGFVAELLFE
jgi:hypothetical protein